MKIRTKLSKKTLAILVVAVVSLSFVASGAIVDYLSNEVTQEDIEVKSPFKVWTCNHMDYNGGVFDLNEDGSFKSGSSNSWDNIISDDNEWTGGSTGTFWALARSRSNNDLDATVRITLTCWNGISDSKGEEIDSIEWSIHQYDSGDSSWEQVNSGDMSAATMSREDVDGNGAWDKLYIDFPFTGFPAGEASIAEITFTTNQYMTGTYDISIQIV